MEFHEKSLELNITHELLNLADSWYWFLADVPLWRYWRPGVRMPFIKLPKSISGGFHITTEGKDDPTGKAGGGFDVRIKTGKGGHLLFIQYKKGDLSLTSPDPKSEFNKAPHEHFIFKFNNTSTNQHFVLRNLANGEGGKLGNAVVYAFPLIKDMEELEANAGKLIRKTKFISIKDIDKQALKNKVSIIKDHEHNFRVGKNDMNRCEVNYFYYYYLGPDRIKEIVTDIIATKFQKTLSYFLKTVETHYRRSTLFEEHIPIGLQQAFIQYIRYLLHFFEVSPSKLNIEFVIRFSEYFIADEFDGYESTDRDVEILTSTFSALIDFEKFIFSYDGPSGRTIEEELPKYVPQFLIQSGGEEIRIGFDEEFSNNLLEDTSYLVI